LKIKGGAKYKNLCMAVDGFPQPAFDGLWPGQDFALWVPDTLHCVFPVLDTAVLSH
jgi:hypothetical protein